MIYEESYQIPSFLAGRDNRVALNTLVNVMLAGSEHQLEQVGAGIDQVREHGVGWVITQYQLTVNQMPQAEVPLVLGTEAISYNKLMTYRDYWVNDAAGNRLATLRGAWVLMDLTTRKLVPIIPEIVARVQAPFDSHVQRFKRLAKLERIDVDVPYRVRYFDIDGNGHVNNSHYFEWLEDSLGAEFLQQHALQTMQIKYAREVTYGSTPHAQAQIDGLTTRHQIVTEGVLNAEAELTWKRRA